MSIEEAGGTSNATVSFLQQEHAKTLKGLHTEIHKLQQKCAKLTFELTMAGGNVTSKKEASSSSSVIEEEFSRNQEQLTSLQSQVSIHKERILLLEHELTTLRKQTRELTREKHDLIRTTQYQLEEKSTTIAHLVSKLQQSQFLLQKVQTATGTSITPSLYHHHAVPSPPSPSSGRRSSGHITRRLRRAITTPLDSTSNEYHTNPSNSILPSTLLGEIKSRDQEQVKQPQLLQRALAMKTTQKPSLLPPIQQSLEEDRRNVILPPSQPPPPINRGKRYAHLNKGGLNSAPCSLRLMNYSTSFHAPSESGDEKEEEEEKEKDKGIIMIKQHHSISSGNNPLYFKPQRKS